MKRCINALIMALFDMVFTFNDGTSVG